MIRDRYLGQRYQRWSLSETVDRGGWREKLWTGGLKMMIKDGSGRQRRSLRGEVARGSQREEQWTEVSKMIRERRGE